MHLLNQIPTGFFLLIGYNRIILCTMHTLIIALVVLECAGGPT